MQLCPASHRRPCKGRPRASGSARKRPSVSAGRLGWAVGTQGGEVDWGLKKSWSWELLISDYAWSQHGVAGSESFVLVAPQHGSEAAAGLLRLAPVSLSASRRMA